MKRQLSQPLKLRTKTLFKFKNQQLPSGHQFFLPTVPTTTVTVDPTTSTTITVTH